MPTATLVHRFKTFRQALSTGHPLTTATVILLASLAHTASATDSHLKPFSANYSSDFKGFTGSGFRSLSQEGEQWTLKFGADATFLVSISIDEVSQMTIRDGQVQPLNYTYKRDGVGRKKPKSAHFDWNTMMANWTQGDKESNIPLQKGSQDPLSYQLKLRMDLKAGKKNLTYPVVDDDEAYERVFVIEGEENIKTSVGTLETVKVKIKRDDNDRETWLWFAKDWDYILVQFLQKERGDKYLITFDDGHLAGEPIKGQ